MAFNQIVLGTPPLGADGDTVRAGFEKTNANFQDIFSSGGLSQNAKALNELAGQADRVPYFTGAGALSLAALTALGRQLTGANTPADALDALQVTALGQSLLDAETPEAARTVLEVPAPRPDDNAYWTYGGSANALTLAAVAGVTPPTAYAAGQQFRFRATAANTGAATINVAGLGAKTAVTVTGAALPPGYIRTDVDTVITYDASIDRFVVGRELERGSNASGNFERLADGSINFQMTPSFTLTATTSIQGVFTLPASVVGIITGSIMVTSVTEGGTWTTFGHCVIRGNTGTTVILQIWSNGPSFVSDTLGTRAFLNGFWY